MRVRADAAWLRRLQRHVPPGLELVPAGESPEPGPAVWLHDTEAGVEERLGDVEGWVVWPGPEGVLLSPWVAVEEEAERRRLSEFLQSLREARAPRRGPTLTALLAGHPFLGEALAALVGGALRAWWEGTPSPAHVCLLQPASLRLLRHALGDAAPRETGDVGRFQPRTETAPGSGREAGRFEHARALPGELVGSPLGLLPQTPQPVRTVNVLAASSLPLLAGGQPELGLGRALDFRRADLSAAFEALERKCSSFEGRQPLVRGSFAALQARRPTVDPRALLLPPADEAPADPRRPPFSPELELDWVEGHSLRLQAPILVPARAVFIGYRRDRWQLQESSNGCALGGSVEEASLHALLELIERDAFLMTWYGRRPCVRLELDSLKDRELLHLRDRAARMGHELRVWRTTVDTPVPSVWVMAVAREAPGARTLSGAGAHLTPARAVVSSLVEVLASLSLLGTAFDAERGRACRADPTQVVTGMDHFHLFGLPEQVSTLDFLDTGGSAPLEEAFAGEARPGPGRGLTDTLEWLVRGLLERHPDVLLVDLSPPRLARQGLRCVRALVPGMLPMTFGHRNRRVQGCARLERWRAPGAGAALLPHPFP